ncbi:hypothetical protein ACOSQ2_027137 [Xanthoceras sorbifolium]
MNVVTPVNESNIEGTGGNVPDIQDVFRAIQSLRDDIISLNNQVDGMGSRVRQAEENDIKGSNECDKGNKLNDDLGSPRTRVPNPKKQDVVAIGVSRPPVIQVASLTETGSLHEKNETELAAATLLTGNAEDKNSTGPTVDEVKLNIGCVVGGVYGPFELSFRLNMADDVIVRYIFDRDLPESERSTETLVYVRKLTFVQLNALDIVLAEDIAGSIHRNYRFSGLHISVQSSTPKQTNLFDCGVYACKYMYTSQRQKLCILQFSYMYVYLHLYSHIHTAYCII